MLNRKSKSMNGTYTFNKENWSGEKATIVVKNNQFEFHGYNFKLEPKTYKIEGQEYTDYVVHGDDWDEPLFRVRDFGDKTFWAYKYDIERTDANPFVLAAKMAAMTI